MNEPSQGLGGLLKRIVESVLLHGGPAAVAGQRVRRRSLVLAYHNVLPDGERPGADGSLHLPRQSFVRQLEILQATCDVVSLEVLLSSDAPDAGSRPRIAITIDDAYRGAVTSGAEELAQRGLPATIFVAPAFIGGASFWWDVVTSRRVGADQDDLRRRALEEWRGMDQEVRAGARAAGLEIIPPAAYAVAATQAELAAAAARPGITLGSHTWNHPNLTRLEGSQLAAELTRPAEWLRAFAGGQARVLPWIAYPYGLSNPVVEAAAAAAGYEGGLRVSGGWMAGPPQNRFALPRYNVPAGISDNGFALRLHGLFCR